MLKRQEVVSEGEFLFLQFFGLNQFSSGILCFV